MSETNRFNIMRLRYKAAFDAYSAIANRNAEITRAGIALTTQQREEEETAAAGLEKLRSALMARPHR